MLTRTTVLFLLASGPALAGPVTLSYSEAFPVDQRPNYAQWAFPSGYTVTGSDKKPGYYNYGGGIEVPRVQTMAYQTWGSEATDVTFTAPSAHSFSPLALDIASFRSEISVEYEVCFGCTGDPAGDPGILGRFTPPAVGQFFIDFVGTRSDGTTVNYTANPILPRDDIFLTGGRLEVFPRQDPRPVCQWPDRPYLPLDPA